MKLNHKRILSSKKYPAYIFEWFYNQQNSQAFPKASWNTKCAVAKVPFPSHFHGSAMITQALTVIYTRNECSSKHADPRTLSMLITRTEIKLAIQSHTSQLSVAVGRHFLPVYACAHVVLFPNDQLLGTRLAPTFELIGATMRKQSL